MINYAESGNIVVIFCKVIWVCVGVSVLGVGAGWKLVEFFSAETEFASK